MRKVAVIDIGKTNVKLALVDVLDRREIMVLTTPNQVLSGPPWPHFDTDAIWTFIRSGLAQVQRQFGIEGISLTTHGACAAFMDHQGGLAAPVLDYEHEGPDELRAQYDELRPPFSETGSPALPMGLNLGAQIFWQLRQDPGLRLRTKQIVTWPQYWGAQLTGVGASDVCSLGCHTDLWNPVKADWSDLVDRLNLRSLMAPAQRPGAVLGHLLRPLQDELGLGPVPVLVGIHDSNASLVSYLGGKTPFSVVSTGTWVIAMAMGGKTVALDPARDTLVNVNALGQSVPSARFMGGREYEVILQDIPASAEISDAESVLSRDIMLLPSVVAGSGPFSHRKMAWTGGLRSAAETEVALGFYLALMTAECLGSIGADGPTYVEGPFAANPWYKKMLEAATDRPVLQSQARTGTAVGAALLFDPAGSAPIIATNERAGAQIQTPSLTSYAQRWRARSHGT